MDIIDWPASDSMRPITPLRLGVNVPKSGFKGFYTGNRETLPHGADRMTLQMTLPPCTAAQAAEREAFLFGAVSRGDAFRFGAYHRPVNRGTAAGSPTVASNALAGARSISLSGVRGTNLLLGGSFEVDFSGNGVAEPWVSYGTGSTGTVTHGLSTTGAVSGTNGQQTFSTALSTTTSDRVGVKQSITDILPGARYAVSAWFTWLQSGNAIAGLYIDWRNSGGSLISGSPNLTGPTLNGTPQRHTHAATAPSGAASCDLYFFAHSRSVLGAASVVIDAAQFEFANAATDFQPPGTLLAGDFISIGGNLLTVGYAGASANDAGVMTVPLTLPLQKPLSSGAAVSISRPQGVWELDLDGIDLDYLGTWLQDGVTLPFIQRIV